LEKQKHAEVTETGPGNRAAQPEFGSHAAADSGRIPARQKRARLLLVLVMVGFPVLLLLTSISSAPSNSNWYSLEFQK